MEKSTGKIVKDLTQGNVMSQLFLFAMPLFLSNTLQALYNLVDMVVVGQVVGGAGMSAVSIGGDMLHLLTFLAMGFSSAGQVIIARLVGAGEMNRVKKIIGTMFTVMFCASIVIALVCFLLRVQLLSVLNTPSEAWDYTMDYLVICIIGLPFIYGYNIVSAILRGMGDSKRPFVFVAIAAIINTVLDLWFVAGLGMGPFGAALATVIAQALSFIVSVVYLYRHKEAFCFDFRLKSFAVDRKELTNLTALGIPMAIQSAAINISKIVLTSWINAEGLAFSAMNGIYSKTQMIVSVISNSFTTAGSSMVGQTLGAKKYDRVPKILRCLFFVGMLIAVVLTGVMLLWSRPVFELFTSDQSVLAEAAILVAPIIVNLFGSGTRNVAFALINGSGNAKLNLAIALIDGMISRVSIAALLGYALKMGCQGFWFGDALSGFVPIIVGMTYYLTGRWRRGNTAA